MITLLGLHISETAEHIRQMGVRGEAVRDEPDMKEDPEWASTVWVYADDGIAISFIAQDGGQFYDDFVVEAVLLAGTQMRAFPLYSGQELILQPTTLPPYRGLDWRSSEADVIKRLGEPSLRTDEGFRYDFPKRGHFVLFTFTEGKLASVRYQKGVTAVPLLRP